MKRLDDSNSSRPTQKFRPRAVTRRKQWVEDYSPTHSNFFFIIICFFVYFSSANVPTFEDAALIGRSSFAKNRFRPWDR